ncbi:MAG: hypothetical protein QHJ73_17000, partial [Armatimonadota bacterium]|nr:hypothetical protein [Armatimonadota bacterium]
IVSTQPLTIETRRGDKVEVQLAERARILRQAELALADLQQGANVIVLPKAQPENGAATAVAVVQLPQMGGGRRGGNRRN